jgi:poly(A) polymerase
MNDPRLQIAINGPQLGAADGQLALRIAKTLQNRGFQALLVGGCVRDCLLGLQPKDFDIATDALATEVLGLFPQAELVGAHFGVVLVHEGHGSNRAEVEVATFRSDGAYTDGRRPGSVTHHASTLDDAQRRDFTVNALFCDAESGEIIDPVGGTVDLRARLIRTVGDPAARFGEDHLRMLRAVRLAARLGFSIEPATREAIRQLAPAIVRISAERIRGELTRILTEGQARRGFELLDDSGLLRELLPEIAAMKDVAQPVQFHPEGDVWEHTLGLLEGLRQSDTGEPVSATLAWGALLHDVGKPVTFDDSSGRIRFNGHVGAGERIATGILSRLRFSAGATARILALIHHHMRFGDLDGMKESTLKRFLRMEDFGEHLELHRLDCTASHGSLDMYNLARQKLSQTPEEVLRPARLISGHDLAALGVKPGPVFSHILGAIEEAQLDGRIRTRDEALALAGELIGSGKSQPGN